MWEHMFVLDTNTKGHLAELEIAAAATRLGVPVLRPLSDHCRSDLAFEIGGRLWRVQCKWGRISADGGAVVVRLGTCSLGAAGYKRTTYSPDEVDLIAVYCGDLTDHSPYPWPSLPGSTRSGSG